MNTEGPIAVFDSGEGGLTVLRHLVAQLPHASFLYAADSAHFPYGEKSLTDVRRWFMEFMKFFMAHHAQAVVIACNTATAAALKDAQRAFPIPIIGVIDPAVQKALEVTKNHEIAVLSTEATWRSEIYPRHLRALNPGVQVLAKPCPILVTMVENGNIEGRRVEREVRDCLSSILSSTVDTIILGCTHFPHMREVFNRIVQQKAAIVDPGEEIATQIAPFVKPAGSLSLAPAVQAWTTGNAKRFTAIAQKLCPNVPMATGHLRWEGGDLGW